MISININLMSGELYKTINVDNLELTYLQIKELFNNLDDKFYKIINNNSVIYTNLYDLDYDKVILNDYLNIVFINFINNNIINNIKQNKGNFLLYLDYIKDDIENNLDLIKFIINQKIDILQYVNDKIKDDMDIIKYAINKINGLQLKYASVRLKNNEEIIKYAVINNYS